MKGTHHRFYFWIASENNTKSSLFGPADMCTCGCTVKSSVLLHLVGGISCKFENH